ncbi:DUF5658 family protein [Methanolobus sp. WCC4]|uniref:DUF5658 family protein n=1 Tax=Methanolobus sp. WCC4 TaxID=3125784 RepID=UPI0030F7B09F
MVVKMYLLAQIKNSDFLSEIWFIFVLFIYGDTATTITALWTGMFYEGNPVLCCIFDHFGYIALVFLKALFMVLFYIVYRMCRNYPGYWRFTKNSVMMIGLLATFSNLRTICLVMEQNIF